MTKTRIRYLFPHANRLMAPLITICIPTRNRPELARRAILAAATDRSLPVQILVLENSDSPSLRPSDFQADDRIEIQPSDRTLSMPDNWERGLELARGDYVAYLSDKDVLLPGAISRAIAVIESNSADVICYRKPGFCDERKILYHYHCDGNTRTIPTRPLLQSWFNNPRHLHSAPMIYNSFFSRVAIDRLRTSTGKLFIGNSPDIATGVLAAASYPSYLQLDQSLVVAHSGAWSNGYATATYGAHNAKTSGFIKEFANDPFSRMGIPCTIASAALEVLLTAKSTHPDLFRDFDIHWQNYLNLVRGQIRSLQIPEDAKRQELAKLTASRCIVPRKFKYRMLASQLLRERLNPAYRALQWLRQPPPQPLSQPAHQDAPPAPWEDRCQNVETPCQSIEEACEIALACNHPSQASPNH